jgi:hypothetical protein
MLGQRLERQGVEVAVLSHPGDILRKFRETAPIATKATGMS